MSILNKLLEKRGLKSIEELDKDERATFDEWQSVLNKETLTTEDIKNFCQSQISVIEGKWSDLNLDQAKKAEFIPYHTVYRLISLAIDSPKAARESLEKNLTQLLK